MNPHRALSLALKTFVATLVAAVAAAVLISAPATTSAAKAPAGKQATFVAPQLDKIAVRAAPAFSRSSYEARVQKWVNVVRKRHHLRPLSLARCTDGVAERWSSHLASSNGFYHQSMTKLLNRCNAYYAGETLGRGSIKPATLVNMWMHSPPHRHILMSKSPTRIGIGSTPNSRGQWVTCANFMRF